jgi:hypothetical protein
MSVQEIKSVLMSHVFVKSVSAGIIAAVLDNRINDSGRMDMLYLQKSASFGGLVGASIASAHFLAPSLTSHIHISDTALYSGKTLEHRLIEVSLGSVIAVGVNRFAFDQTVGSVMNQIGIVVASDMLGEYFSDFVHSKPLNYLQ